MPRDPRGAQRASIQSCRRRRSPASPISLARIVAAATLSLVLVAVIAVPTTAHDLGSRASAGRAVSRTLQPGDVVADHGIALPVPGPGSFVWGELKMVDGSFQTLMVETRLDGRVMLLQLGDEAARGTEAPAGAAAQGDPAGIANLEAAAAASRGPRDCADRYRNLYWWRIPDLVWRFDGSGTPAYLLDDSGSTDAVVAALVRAQDNITSAHNDCQRADRIGARGHYAGLTRRNPNVSAGGGCSGSDGQSVIAFGPLPSYSVAMTCVRGTVKGVAKEADIRINSTDPRWATSMDTCHGDQLLLEAAMTHEFGHAYGLAHASTYRDPWLTMQPLIRACSLGPVTLGMGDMLGLEKKY